MSDHVGALSNSDPRIVALNWLVQVVEHGRSVNNLLAMSEYSLTPQQKSQAKQMLFGCVRYFHQLKTLADNLLAKPFKPKDTDLLMVILLGLYQLKYLSTPDHAAISESVELTRKLDKSWAAGLVNGVLRSYQRSGKELEAKLHKSIQFQYSHPGWMVKKIQQDWPEDAQDILLNNNLQAPMTIRVNSLQTTRELYLEKLACEELSAYPHPIAPDAIVLSNATDVFNLPGFATGEVTVQDAAAQLAVEMLDLQAEMQVLDGCAAPGGKTTHILQRQPNINLTAVEMSTARAEKIQQTLLRLDMHCDVLREDINAIDKWWDGQLFDRILLDVPCSASGVIRRNPDIKIHRKVTDIAPLVAIQQQILSTAWGLLKPGGKLVYATCSVFKDENQQQILNFLQNNVASLLTMPEHQHSQLSLRTHPGYQIFPGEWQMDGFYLCGLSKPE